MNDIQFKIDSAYRTLSDMGITLKKYTLTDPEKKVATVDVPFSNLRLNCMAGLTSNTVYKNRKATLNCKIEYENANTVLTTYNTFVNTVHGKSVKFNTVADYTIERYLYEGRVEVGTLSTGDESWAFTVTIDAKPFATLDPIDGYTIKEWMGPRDTYETTPYFTHTWTENTGVRLVCTMCGAAGASSPISGNILHINNSSSMAIPGVSYSGSTGWYVGYINSSTGSGNTVQLEETGPHTLLTECRKDFRVDSNFLNDGRARIYFMCEGQGDISGYVSILSKDTGNEMDIPTRPKFSAPMKVLLTDESYLYKIYCYTRDIYITEKGEVVHRLFPVMRNSDSAVGYYDAVSNVFYEKRSTTGIGSDRTDRRL